MYNRNKVVPRIVPCGTPGPTVTQSDRQLLTLTLCQNTLNPPK